MNRNEEVDYLQNCKLRLQERDEEREREGGEGLDLLCFRGEAGREQEDLGTPTHKRYYNKFWL